MRKEESDNSDNTNSDKIEETNNKETEKLPQTGLETTKLLEIELLALGAAIMIRKKQKQKNYIVLQNSMKKNTKK